MIKQHPLGYLGMNQDMSKSKTKTGFYFSAENIRIKSTDTGSSFALTNEKGNEILLSIPVIYLQKIKTRFQYASSDTDQTATLKFLKYKRLSTGCEIEDNFLPNGGFLANSGQQTIIGAADIRGGAVLFTTDGFGWDCFWELKGIDSGDITLDLLYCNDLGLSKENQIQILYNYENSLIEKVYFCDGEHQLRFFNMRQSVDNGDLVDLVDLGASSINNVSKYDLSQPQIVASDGGGIHTSGMIQYGYNLYILNGSQTSISPLSRIKAITKGGNLGGGILNEEINRTMLVNVNNIDQTYTHIRLYAIKYTSFNQIPSISLIADREIDNYDTLSYYDDGNIIEAITPEEFLFLGSDPYIPQHIESKDNRLFSLGIKEQAFDLDIDVRCYGHDTNGDVKIWENVKKVNNSLQGNELTVNTTTYSVPEKHDSVNRDYDTYAFTKTGTTTGTYEQTLISVYPGGATSSGNVVITINGNQIYLIPVLAGDNSMQVCMKMRDFLIANAPSHTFSMFQAQNLYVLTIQATVFGNQGNTICSDQLGINFLVTSGDGSVDDGVVPGAEGKFFRLSLAQTEMAIGDAAEFRFLKDREIYRFGIIFFNGLGQQSAPKWLCDVQSPKGNLEGKYNQVVVDIKSEFYTWLNSQTFAEDKAPVGYKIVRANRQIGDRTVLTQGVINPMINNFPGNTLDGAIGTVDTMYLPTTTKMPSLIRTFDNVWPLAKISNWRPLSWNKDDSQGGPSSSREEFRAAPLGNMVSNSYQFNNMMQMFSPELMFENVSIDSSYKLRVLGMVTESNTKNWGKEFNINNLSTITEVKFDGGVGIASPGVSYNELKGSRYNLYDFGFFGPTNANATIHINQMYREFKGGFIPAPNERVYDMYGTPEVSQLGENGKAYNNDEQFKYNNNLIEMRVDVFDQDSTNDDAGQGLFGHQSNGAQCITFVEGSDDVTSNVAFRKSITDFYLSSGITETSGLLLCEFVRDEEYKYVGNMYGGNTYETKSVTDYLPIGEYQDIGVATQLIKSPGDTYVGDFRFQKLSKTGNDLSSTTYDQTTEIVSYITETSVDLKNRADKSANSWDATWQADYEEFQNYNRVYSQQANLINTTAPGFKFKEIQEFDTRVISSKLKSPGEAIDSWSDPLVNEVLDLDGKYGPITGSVSYKDEIYALQESATALLSINPRAQVNTSDGLGLELGTGGILSDYKYISTEYGTLNKWSLQSTDNGFYYFDLNKQSILRFNGQGLQNISNAAGMHSYFINKTNRADLKLDNPVNLKGISSGYDAANGDVFMTFLQDKPPIAGAFSRSDEADNYTLCWNEETNSFTSFYRFTPAFYMSQGSKVLTTNFNSNEIWLHGIKGSSSFYGTRFDSKINFTVSPPSLRPSIFTNLTYNMESKDQDGYDVPNNTFNKIRLSNNYQSSNWTFVTLRKNAKRRDRLWNITLPRAGGSRDRIKSPWASLELILNNDDSHEVIVHDLIVSYTEY